MSASPIVTAFRIVSLPAGFTTEEKVVALVQEILDIGTVASVDVQQRAYNGAPYYTAFIELSCWTGDDYSNSLLEQLMECGKDTVAMGFGDNTFFWPNGKPMNHLSFKALDRMPNRSSVTTAVSAGPTESEWPLSDSDWKSIYIPCIPDDLRIRHGNVSSAVSVDSLTFMFEKCLNLGEVSRIDFVNQPKDDRTVKTAYVHFKKWNENRQVEELRNQLNTSGSKKIYSFGLGLERYSLTGCNIDQTGNEVEINRYLVLKINHKPIPDAPEGANAAQLSAANVYLENLVKEKDAEIEKLRAELAAVKSLSAPVGMWDKGPMELSELNVDEEGEVLAVV
jgi:hypothetical protein